MANNLTDFAEAKILDWLFNGLSMTQPTSLFVSLHTSDPGDDGAGGEVSTSGTGYARKEVDPNGGTPPVWNLAVTEGSGANDGFMVDNDNDIVFGPASSDWGSITHISIWDNATAGNAWYTGALTAARTVQTGGTLTFAAGDLVNALR